MTAFDDILKAEQEAEKSIATAREEMVEAVANARSERKTRIEVETAKLNEIEERAIESHQSHITEVTEKIQKEVETQIALVEKKFETHKADLNTTLKKKFA